jgi:hypothetical protein
MTPLWKVLMVVVMFLGSCRPSSPPDRAETTPGELYQYDSFQVTNTGIFHPEKVTIIDDVLTKGCTAFASAMRLHEAFPNAEIRVFASMRTQGLVAEISAIKDPAIGEIAYNGYDTTRNP